MINREELASILRVLREAPAFGHFVKMLRVKRDDAVTRWVNAPATEAESGRGEIRAYDTILRMIDTNTPP